MMDALMLAPSTIMGSFGQDYEIRFCLFDSIFYVQVNNFFLDILGRVFLG